ncbi:MAG: hypothetical protein IPL12_21560 [Bacteroidetes bacterium]|nr:hypothetical protein [Bacteroidota bacterium]
MGPYSQAISAGGFGICFSQIANDPATCLYIQGIDIKAETCGVMENLKAIIEQAGCKMNNVVKCTIFLSDMNYFADVNAVYGEYFT